jgi:hypothetical protein
MRRPTPHHALAAVALLTAAVAATPGLAEARSAARPDLVAPSGAIRAEGTALAGSFAIKNAGTARAGASRAALVGRSGGKRYALKSFGIGALGRSGSQRVSVAISVPASLQSKRLSLQVCADSAGAITERSESNNCRTVGSFRPATTTDPGSADGVTAPVAFTKETHFTLGTSQGRYRIVVPQSYDSSHNTPSTLFVWAHGCGGDADGDLYTITPGDDRSYIAISLLGRDGGCWSPDTDSAKVLAAIADVKTHFNVDPRRVILGGYSSGGDLAYRTAFYNSRLFAGLIVQNTSPFRDTGSSQAASLAAATFKFPVVHLAQTGDDTYQIATVRRETDAMKAAGFDVTRIERPGGHYNNNTDTYLQTLGLPHINDGWQAPAA